MNSRFINALRTNDAFTENGMPTHSSSGSYVMDMFFKLGGARRMSDSELENMLIYSMSENPLLAVKNVFYNRDVRGGQGERRAFRTMTAWLAKNFPEIVLKNIDSIPFYGRWDDLFALYGINQKIDEKILSMVRKGLSDGDKLLAKWLPKEGKSRATLARTFARKLSLSSRDYRKLISSINDVVENKMCQNKWDDINYNHVPSVASFRYRFAFGRHDTERYGEWLESLTKPESGNKIHADAIFPHDIVRPYLGWGHRAEDLTAEAQWKALPDYVQEGVSFIPVCDVSGSMSGEPMEVCVSLGLYLSERNKSVFKDAFITFSGRPQLQVLEGSLRQRVSQLAHADWGINTNLEAVFKLILNKAVQANLAEEDMPQNIIILSDMQFDSCVQTPSNNAINMIRGMYEASGYKIPNVIFWNLRTSKGVTVKVDESGTALVSGFSPSIMKNILGGNISPEKLMLETLNSERYSRIVI